MNKTSKQHDLMNVISQLPYHVYWVDRNGVTLGCNQNVASFLGYDSIDDIIGKSHSDLYSPEEAAFFDKKLSEIMATKKACVVEESAANHHGDIHYFQSYKVPLFDKQGQVEGLIGISVDVTDKKLEIKSLKDVISMLPGHIWWADRENRLLGCNKAMANSFGFESEDELIGTDPYELLPTNLPEDLRKEIAQRINDVDFAVMETGKKFEGEEIVEFKDKKTIYLSEKAPLKDFNGNIIGLLGIAQDITENKQERKTLKHILSVLPGHVWWTDKDGCVLGCNENMAYNFGFSHPDELIGLSTYELLPNNLDTKTKTDLAKKIDDFDNHLMSTEQSHSSEEQFFINGEERTLLSEKRPIKDLDGHVTGIVGISQDITELKEAQQAAEKANKVKSEFIANMSHDLRTPITGMLGEAEMIENSAESAEIRESGRFLRQATNQLLRLTNDILEFISLDGQAVEDKRVVFDPIELINNVMILMQVSLKQKDLNFTLDIHKDVPKAVKGYGLYFERILNNLIGNAIKFTPKGGISLHLTARPHELSQVMLTLTIEDTGIGIPADKYHAIFEKFTKLSSSYQGLFDGSGLGLYSVREYVALMQGHIDVQSIVGKGTKFTVSLPFERAVAAETVPIQISQSKAPDVTAMTEDTKQSCEIKPINFGMVHVPRILVVEDSQLPARALIRFLGEHHVDVTLVKTGEEAVKAALKQRFDLIFMDIGLPGIDGVEATKQIRDLPKHSKAPIVAVTGHIRQEKKQACIDAGMQDVYSKPLTRDQLKTIIKDYITHQTKSGGALMDMQFSKDVLNIDNMMTQFLTDDPKQLLDMLEVALDYIPSEIDKLNVAVEANDIDAIKHLTHSLKGGVSYISAPNASKALISWDDKVRNQALTAEDLAAMNQELSIALTELCDALSAVVKQVKAAES